MLYKPLTYIASPGPFCLFICVLLLFLLACVFISNIVSAIGREFVLNFFILNACYFIDF